ncbi:MAG: NAD(P)H-dependent glycerol-3-phosphate dehydrogenase [Chloroflexota bacterium]
MAQLAVLNAGGWGTALAVSLSASGHSVRLWARRNELALELAALRENRAYLAGVTIPESVSITSDLAAAVDGAHLVLAVPISRFLPRFAELLAQVIRPGTPVIHGTKGLDPETLMRPSEILSRALQNACPVGMLSGPTHAEEVGRGIPTAAVVAFNDASSAAFSQSILNSERFRVYTNGDLVGVELCAALKNVYAIAAGVSDGLGYGDNAKSALLTRCIAELYRLVSAMGGQPGTVAGLAGMGDLVATCTSRHSRNRGAGERLGRGENLDVILGSSGQAIEGVFAARSVRTLVDRFGVEMPIAMQVHAVLYLGRSPRDAITELMARTATQE